jgi:Enterochelin esterase and related enzymes
MMIVPVTSTMSLRIAQLEQSINAGNLSAIEDFWQEIATRGTPLIEAIDGDETHVLATFIWRDPGDTRNVLVLYGAPQQGDMTQYQMKRLLTTDIWYKTYVLPADTRTTYLLSINDSLVPLESYDDLMARIPSYRPDPLNPQEFTIFGDPHEYKVSILELPKAPPQPWIVAQRGVPKGKIKMHMLDSSVLQSKQHIIVYTPPGYQTSGEAYNLLVLFDGWAYLNFTSAQTMMDNLLHAGKIPPYVMVMHSFLDPEARARELPCYAPFCEFLVQELIPWAREKYHITTDPTKTVVGGSCYGGLAAAFVALKAPEIFGNVISQSGSFWWPRPRKKDEVDDSDTEWLTHQFAMSPKLPIRFSIEIGLLEKAIVEYDQLTTNRNLRDVLLSKGYEVDYSEYNGGHDFVCWRGSLADRFLALAAKDRT